MIIPEVNEYYLSILTDMTRQLEFSKPCKRYWTLDDVTGQPDYSLIIRSTFLDWSKFFYIKTPKKLRTSYLNVDSDKPYIDGFYNGTTVELLRLLNRAKSGYIPTPDRLISAFDLCLSGFYDYMNEYEEQYGEKYF